MPQMSCNVCEWQHHNHTCLFGAHTLVAFAGKQVTPERKPPCRFVQQARHLCACSVPASWPGPAVRPQRPAHLPLLVPHSSAPASAGCTLQHHHNFFVVNCFFIYQHICIYIPTCFAFSTSPFPAQHELKPCNVGMCNVGMCNVQCWNVNSGELETHAVELMERGRSVIEP